MEASSGDAARERRWRRRREGAVWSIGVGIAMLFLGGVSASLAMGGAVMVAGGGVGVAWSSLMLRRHRQDPWSDPEIDAWEREHFPPRPPAGGT